MIIDGHVHFWDPADGFDIKPIRDEKAMARPFLPDALRPLCRRHGIDRVVLSQSAPEQAETRFLLDRFAADPMVSGIIGWADLANPRLEERLDEFCREKKFRGVRAQLRRMPDDYLLRAPVRAGLKTMARRGLTVVFLAEQRHLPLCLDFLREEPALRAVINHAGLPDIRSGDLGDWRRMTQAFATDTGACIQLAGLTHCAGPGWTIEQLKPVADHLFRIFGAGRMLYGSDWPMIDLYASYDAWWETVQVLVDAAGLGKAERAELFGGTAVRAYGLPGS